MARRRSTINRKEYMDTIDANQPRHRMDRTANASSLLKANEDMLKNIDDLDELISTVLDLVEPTVGQGMSEANWRKFQMDLMSAAQQGTMNVKRFLYNYALKGYGQGVLNTAGSTYRESAKEIARTILEHSDMLFLTKASVAEIKLAKAVEPKIGVSINESDFESFVQGMPDDPKNYHRYLAETVAKAYRLSLVESAEQSIAGILLESSGSVKDLVVKHMQRYGFYLG